VVEDGGWHDGAVGATATRQSRTLGQRIVDERIEPGPGFLGHHRPDHALRVADRIARRQLLGTRRELGDEGVGHRFVDDEPFGRHADLALVEERPEDGCLDRFVHVGIVEHQQRRLAAQLQQALGLTR